MDFQNTKRFSCRPFVVRSTSKAVWIYQTALIMMFHADAVASPKSSNFTEFLATRGFQFAHFTKLAEYISSCSLRNSHHLASFPV